MRFKLVEKMAYHYGDLDFGKKAESRKVMSMSNRGTGHFGTGFYMLGEYDPDNAYSYAKRGHWEIDLSSYNLFRPRTNSEAYELHDALHTLNYFNLHNLFADSKKLMKAFEECDPNNTWGFDDERWNLDDEQINDYYIGNVRAFLGHLVDTGVISEHYSEWFEDQYLDKNHLRYYEVEKEIEKIIENIDDEKEEYNRLLTKLTRIFGGSIGEMNKRVEDAITSTSQEDSKSTVFMKSLGYEGIDVTHLNHDSEGLRGLDNFSYGTVVYDLKPGTYKKIKDATKNSDE